MKFTTLLALAAASATLLLASSAVAETNLDTNRDGSVNVADGAYIESLIGTYNWMVQVFDPNADIDSSGKITVKDLTEWSKLFVEEPGPDPDPDPGPGPGPGPTPAACDQDFDGDVDKFDYAVADMDNDDFVSNDDAILFRTECDGSAPFVLMPGDIVHDRYGALHILRDGVSQQLTMKLGRIDHISTSGQSIIYLVTLYAAGDLAILQLFPDGHQELLMHPATYDFAYVD